MADRELVYNGTNDIPKTELRDFAGEKMVKLYVYEMINVNKTKAIAAEITTSFIKLVNNSDTFKNLPKDDNGNHYIEILCDELLDFRTIYEAGENSFGKKLMSVETYQALSTENVFSNVSSIDMYKMRILPIVATFDPITPSFNGDKKVVPFEGNAFILSPFEEIAPTEYGQRQIDKNGLYNFTLSDYRIFEQQFSFSKINFYLDNKNVFDQTKARRISINTNKDALLTTNFIRVYADWINTYNGDNTKNTSIVDSFIVDDPANGLRIYKAIPIAIDGRITMYSEWNDRKRIPLINSAQNLRQVMLSQMSQDDYNAIEDMVLITYLNRSSFRDLTPITDDTLVNYGKMNINYNVGHGQFRAQEISGTGAKEMNDHIYMTRMSQTTNKDAFQAWINFFSKYIVSSYVVEQGTSTFYDAWSYEYLPNVLTVGCNKTYGHVPTANENVALVWNITSVSKTNLKTYWNENKNVSAIPTIDWDKVLTPIALPLQVQAYSKTTSNGDVASTSGTEVSFAWYYQYPKNEDKNEMFSLKPVFDKFDWKIHYREKYKSINQIKPIQTEFHKDVKIEHLRFITISGIFIDKMEIKITEGDAQSTTLVELPVIDHFGISSFLVSQHNIILS